MVVAKETTAVTSTPSGDGTTYTPANAAFGSGYQFGVTNEYLVYKGTGTSVTVTGLTNCILANFTIFTRKGTTWSSGNATSDTPIAPLTLSSVAPLDMATNVATNTKLTLTFSQNVSISSTGGSAAATSITITENGSPFQVIGRGSGSISISSNVVTVTVNALNLNKTYDVVVGSKVFKACGVDFAGVSTGNWDFTSSAGIDNTPVPSTTVCTNVYGPLGSISLQETAVNNFQGVSNTTKTLILKFDVSGFAFKPGGVTLAVTGGGDISNSSSIASASFSSITVNIYYSLMWSTSRV